LFQGHDCLWIPDEYPGGGNISMFNNGPELGYSTVVEWDIPETDENGNYPYTTGEAYGPLDLVWEYHPEQEYQDWNFFSGEISGAHRLPNGNTLMCSGTKGFFSEVNQAKEVLWEYINPMEQEEALYWNEEPSLDNRGHGMNGVFKIHKYPPDYPAFDGKELIPQGVIEQGGPVTILISEEDPGSLQVYPNPVEDVIYVKSETNSGVSAEIFDMYGKLLIRKLLEGDEKKIDMAQFQAGMYLVKLSQDKGSHSQIIIKK